LEHKTIYFIITQRCNCQCYFCIRKNIESYGDIDITKLREITTELSSHYSGSEAIITGGEFFLHDDWQSILSIISSRFKSVYITSNGTFPLDVFKKLEPFLVSNVYIQLSIDGIKEIHNKIRGLNTFELLDKNIIRLQKYKTHLALSTTVSKQNINNLNLLISYLNSFSFSHWKCSPEQTNDANIDNIIMPKEWNELIDKILPLCRFKVLTKKLFAFELMDEYLKKDYRYKTTPIYNCGYASSKFYIMPNFDVYPCTCVETNKLCNLIEDPLWLLDKRLLDLQNCVTPQNQVCRSCRYVSICKGGCPGYSLKFFGKLGMGDIRCPLIQKYIE